MAREIALGPKCQAVLRPLLAAVTEDSWVLPSRTGEPYTVTGLASAIRKPGLEAASARERADPTICGIARYFGIDDCKIGGARNSNLRGSAI